MPEPAGCWLLVLSRDVSLAVALSQMGPVGTNVTLGLCDVDDQQMDIVAQQALLVVSGVNPMCHLGRMQWDKGRAQVGCWGYIFRNCDTKCRNFAKSKK